MSGGSTITRGNTATYNDLCLFTQTMKLGEELLINLLPSVSGIANFLIFLALDKEAKSVEA